MKKKSKKNKIIIFFLSLFSFIPCVSAVAISSVIALSVSAVGVLIASGMYSYNGLYSGTTYADYDDRISLFDGLENNIPVCDSTINNYPKWDYCDNGTVPSLTKLINDFPYLVRFTVTDNSTNNSYYIFGFYESSDVIGTTCYGDSSTCIPIINSPQFTISMLPTSSQDSSFHYALNSSPRVLGSFHPSYQYYNISYVPFNTSRPTSGVSNHWRYLLDRVNDNYSVKIDTNFNIESDKVEHDVVIGPTFETDIDVTVKPGYYLRLFPKRASSFSSYFLTDNNFLYNYSTYDSVTNSILSSNQYGKLTEINFGSLGKYPWFKWGFEFKNEDISSNKFLELYNSNKNVDLHIKFFREDFYYYLLDENSNCTSVNGMCIPNNYNDLFMLDNSLGDIKNVYDNGDYDSGLSFIKDIPNMIKDFVNSFTFIGVLFTSFFTIFTGSIANYFYIIFGLMIIMIIIKILK